MNKYQEALNYLDWHCSVSHNEQQSLLQELVDRATPKKLIREIDGSHGEIVYFCPICESLNYDNKEYHTCWNCGQSLDWINKERRQRTI